MAPLVFAETGIGKKMREDLRGGVMTRLKALVDARAYDEVYDENGNSMLRDYPVLI